MGPELELVLDLALEEKRLEISSLNKKNKSGLVHEYVGQIISVRMAWPSSQASQR